MSNHALLKGSRADTASEGPTLKRQCACEAQGETCARCAPKHTASRGRDRAEGGPGAVRHSSGAPLDEKTRTSMAARFGHDFSGVRVHTDAHAHGAAAANGAAAYTIGDDIVFGANWYAPQHRAGQALIAHELAHVVQQQANVTQGEPLSSARLEAEAGDATAAFLGASPVPALSSGQPLQLARMSVEDAERKLWGLVPAKLKPQLQPAAEKLKGVVDQVIPPGTELPKGVSDAVENTSKAVELIASVSGAGGAPAADKKDAPAAPKQTAAASIKVLVKKKARDYTMKTLGSYKGLALEVTNIVDTLAWVSHAGNELTEGAISHGIDLANKSGLSDYAARHGVNVPDEQAALKFYHTYVSTYRSLQQQAQKVGLTEETTNGEVGQIAAGGFVTAKFNALKDYTNRQLFSDVPAEDVFLFDSYEAAELETAIELQGALALVGAEEVQVGLKVLSLIGSVKGLVEDITKTPHGWLRDVRIVTDVVNIALSLIGLRQSAAANKIVSLALASGSLVQAVPAAMKLHEVYADKQLAANPYKRHEALVRAWGAFFKVVAQVVMDIAQRARHAKKSDLNVSGEPVAAAGEPAVNNTRTVPQAQPHTEPHAAPIEAPAAAPAQQPVAAHEASAPKTASAEAAPHAPLASAAQKSKAAAQEIDAAMDAHPKQAGESEAGANTGAANAKETPAQLGHPSELELDGVPFVSEGDLIKIAPHGAARRNRRALNVSGRDVQSMHVAPQSVMEQIPGYRGRDAFTQLGYTPIHSGMDARWKAEFQRLRRARANDPRATAQEIHDIVADSIRQAPGIPNGQKQALIARLHDEMFVEYGLDPQQMLTLPYERSQSSSQQSAVQASPKTPAGTPAASAAATPETAQKPPDVTQEPAPATVETTPQPASTEAATAVAEPEGAPRLRFDAEGKAVPVEEPAQPAEGNEASPERIRIGVEEDRKPQDAHETQEPTAEELAFDADEAPALRRRRINEP